MIGHSFPDRQKLIRAYNDLYHMHPHHVLPLETDLPKALQHESREPYRIVMTMILSLSTSDKRLSVALGHLFKRYPSFESLRGIKKEEAKHLFGSLENGGIGLGLVKNNAKRLIGFLKSYFEKWDKELTQENIRSLQKNKSQIGPKLIQTMIAYCLGNRNAFPLDNPAFKALCKLGLFEDKVKLNEARDHIIQQLSDIDEAPLINFHEMLRFLWQANRKSEDYVAIGWNAWRILCSSQRENIDAHWIHDNLITEDETLANQLWEFYSMLVEQ
jgi:endonuclease III